MLFFSSFLSFCSRLSKVSWEFLSEASASELERGFLLFFKSLAKQGCRVVFFFLLLLLGAARLELDGLWKEDLGRCAWVVEEEEEREGEGMYGLLWDSSGL